MHADGSPGAEALIINPVAALVLILQVWVGNKLIRVPAAAVSRRARHRQRQQWQQRRRQPRQLRRQEQWQRAGCPVTTHQVLFNQDRIIQEDGGGGAACAGWRSAARCRVVPATQGAGDLFPSVGCVPGADGQLLCSRGSPQPCSAGSASLPSITLTLFLCVGCKRNELRVGGGGGVARGVGGGAGPKLNGDVPAGGQGCSGTTTGL